MRRKKAITLKGLATELQLSVQTVSKALRGQPGMSEETRREVMNLASKRGYITREQKQSLALEQIPIYPTQKRRFIHVTTGYAEMNHLLLQGLQESLVKLQHTVETIIYPTDLPHDRIQDWIEEYNIVYADGIFISPLIPYELEEKLLQLEMPRILMNFPPAHSKVDSVIWDVYNAMQQSIDHLVERGHQRIMYIGDIEARRGFRLRWQAFHEAMEKAKLPVIEQEHFTKNPVNSTNDLATQELIHHLKTYKPTALLCSIDFNLGFVYYAASLLGKEIYTDYSLISLEAIEQTFMHDVTRPILLVKESAYRAAEKMLWRMANPDMPYEHIRIEGGFHEGNTVKKI